MSFSPEMFHLFKLYTYLTCKVNFSVDTIQHDRFTYERKIAKRFGAIEETPLGRNPLQDQRCPSRTGRWLGEFIEDVLWMLEYNQLNLLHLLLFMANITVLSLISVLSLCYMFRVRDRDQITGHYFDPVLGFFESIYLTEIWSKTDDTGGLHQFALIICLPLIARRIECLFNRLRNAKLNKYRYVKLDAIQMNIAQTDNFGLKSFGSLGPFLVACANHKCDRKFALRGPNGKRLKLIATKLIGLNKIDWLYCYNLISFDGCFRESCELIKLRHLGMDDYSEERHSVVRYDDTKKTLERILALCRWRTNSSETDRLFSARPFHRLHPRAILPITIIYVMAVSGYLFIIAIGIITYYYPYMEPYDLDSANVMATLPRAFVHSFEESKNLAAFLLISLYLSYAGINMVDVALLVHNAVVQLSRAVQTISMINVEINFQRNHLKAFSKYLLESDLTIDGLSEFKSALPSDDDDDDNDDDDNNSSDKFCRLKDHHRWSDHRSVRADDYIFSPPTVDAGNPMFFGKCARSRNIEQLIKRFHVSTIDPEQVIEFNENIKYLLIIIRVLHQEHNDLRAHFTWSLNLSVLAGTVGLSIASSLFYNSVSFHQNMSTSFGTATIVLPLLVSLFMGATSEICFRNITRRIRYLMVNELRLVSVDNVKKLQKVYSHLSMIENRSFMILGNLPLTFGSLTSVSVIVSLKSTRLD